MLSCATQKFFVERYAKFLEQGTESSPYRYLALLRNLETARRYLPDSKKRPHLHDAALRSRQGRPSHRGGRSATRGRIETRRLGLPASDAQSNLSADLPCNRSGGTRAIGVNRRVLARVAILDAVGSQLDRADRGSCQDRVDAREKIEKSLDVVGLGELYLVPDEQGLERLLCRLLAVESDRLPELDAGYRKAFAGQKVSLGLGEPVGGKRLDFRVMRLRREPSRICLPGRRCRRSRPWFSRSVPCV